MLPLLRDQARLAAEVMDRTALDYLETGSGDEVTLGEAELAWRDWRLVPSVLAGVDTPSTATTVLGHDLAAPVLVAPTAFHRLAHAEGELATADGVAASGSLLVVSSRVTVPIEDLGARLARSGTPWWWQSYLVRDRGVTAALAERAVAAGATAVVLTGDTPYVGIRARGDIAPLPVSDDLLLVNMGRHLRPGADPEVALEQAAATLDDIGWLTDLTGLPVLVKGVLGGPDAVRCLDAGAAGVVVSNHGGRQLDRAVASARALPAVVDAVGGRAPVLVDGGIRSGRDVLVALALGASAVLLGRPVVRALAVDGAAGVAAALGAVRDDLAHSLGLLGVDGLPALAARGRACLVPSLPYAAWPPPAPATPPAPAGEGDR